MLLKERKFEKLLTVAQGSINPLLKGKMFNRCKGEHTLLVKAIYGLHMQKFPEDINVSDDLITDLENIAA